MNDQENLALELAKTKAHLQATQEFLSEGIKALLLHTRYTWHFSPEDVAQAREAQFSISREEDGGLSITLEEDEGEESEEEDYFTQELNKRLGFDVSDLQALQKWWRSFMEEEMTEAERTRRKIQASD